MAVVGAHDADESLRERAEGVGRELGRRGAVVVSGGLGGVMEAASRGAHERGGRVIGVTMNQFKS
ncbi:MAG TPA: hypothetical protein VFQ12_03880, partial [Thermoleophilaceae bacterium]|nr:hypothetical protein [Thermoleophilaceae bacterium]